jgi:subtilisin family serine protease
MKKLLFLFLLPCFINFSSCYVPRLIYSNIEAKNTPKNETSTRYWEQQLVVNFPTNSADSVTMEAHLINNHYERISVCPCSSYLQLWGAGRTATRSTPDGQDQSPPPPPPTGGKTKNYLVVDPDTSIKFRDTMGVKLRDPYPQPFDRVIGSGSNNQVLIGIDDSGIELKLPTSYSYLYRNTNPPFVCKSNLIREGEFGYNVLNRNSGTYPYPLPRVGGNRYNQSEPIDDDGHGTFINGIITGEAIVSTSNTNSDYIGQHRNVELKIIHARFFSSRKNDATLFDALCGVHYALSKGARVINASWRAKATDKASVDSLTKAFIPTLEAIKKNGAILVTGAGNDTLKEKLGEEQDRYAKIFPASFSRHPEYGNYVIAVGAWDLQSNNVPYFSNEGSFVDIYAPGVNIISTQLQVAPFWGKAVGSGTSYAAPYVSRLAAILIGNGVPVQQVKSHIINSADNLPYRPSYNNQMPVKMLNHRRALENLRR